MKTKTLSKMDKSQNKAKEDYKKTTKINNRNHQNKSNPTKT